MLPIGTAMAWLIVGEERTHDIWINWVFTLSWAINIELAIVMCMIKVKKNENEKDISDQKHAFRTWFFLVTGIIATKVIVKLCIIFINPTHYSEGSTVEFVINVVFYFSLAYPWGNFYDKQK